MQELERLIELARKRLLIPSIRVGRNESGWYLIKQGNESEDLYDATFDQVLARLREWAGEPEPKPEPMTVTELMALRDRAASVTGGYIAVMIAEHVTLSRGGIGEYACNTLEEVVAKLTEWATPPLPKFATLENVPMAWIQGCASGVAMTDDARTVVEICRETMAKLQNLQHP